jgi:hypothetical protein
VLSYAALEFAPVEVLVVVVVVVVVLNDWPSVVVVVEDS